MRYSIVLDPRHPADRMLRSARTFVKTKPVILSAEEMTLEIYHEPWLKITEAQDLPVPAAQAATTRPKRSRKKK